MAGVSECVHQRNNFLLVCVDCKSRSIGCQLEAVGDTSNTFAARRVPSGSLQPSASTAFHVLAVTLCHYQHVPAFHCCKGAPSGLRVFQSQLNHAPPCLRTQREPSAQPRQHKQQLPRAFHKIGERSCLMYFWPCKS